MQKYSDIVIVRGAGDIATGTIQKLYRAGMKLLLLEIERPNAIRLEVALCEAVYSGTKKVEDVLAKYVKTSEEIEDCWDKNIVPLVVDPDAKWIEKLKPFVVVDAILAKKNLGTNMSMAPITIALGPGFQAGKDVHAVIETMRGHNLGRLILEGSALANTGIPGEVGGASVDRVIHSPADGFIKNISKIGETVKKEQVIAYIGDTPVYSKLDGVLRGLIKEGCKVHKGLKIADVDPRDVYSSCFTISDKARNIGGAVLEAIMYFKYYKNVK